jgi:hypothetical protein
MAARMLHLRAMTKHELSADRRLGDNAAQLIRTLRDWLAHLAAHTTRVSWRIDVEQET